MNVKRFGPFLFAALLTASPLHAELVDKIVAIVNQTPITLYEVDQAFATVQKNLSKLPANERKNINNEELKKQAIDYLIDETLLTQEMEKQGIRITDQDLGPYIASIAKSNNTTVEGLKKQLSARGMSFEEYKDGLKKQLKHYRFVQQVLGTKVRVSEEEVDSYYRRAVSQKSNGTAEIAQLVIPFEGSPSAEGVKTAQKKAFEVYQKAKSGADFEKLIRQYGGSGSGDVGSVSLAGLDPKIAEKLASISVGGVTEPVVTPSGVVIVKLLKQSGSSSAAISEGESQGIKEEIRNRLLDNKMQVELKKYLDQQRSKAYIEMR